MDQSAITRYIADNFAGVDVVVTSEATGAPEIAWGDTFFSYDPRRNLPPNRRLPFATIVTKDYGDFDRASNLDRAGVFRLNISVSNHTYRSLFGAPPSARAADWIVQTEHDFAALDRLLPHPVYAPQFWVCVLNPSAETFQVLRPLLAEAYDLAVRRQRRGQPDDG